MSLFCPECACVQDIQDGLNASCETCIPRIRNPWGRRWGNEFKAGLNKSLEGWNNEDRNIENPVCDYQDINHELQAEKQVNNAICENQLGDPQYELIQPNGKCGNEVRNHRT